MGSTHGASSALSFKAFGEMCPRSATELTKSIAKIAGAAPDRVRYSDIEPCTACSGCLLNPGEQ